jgi:predicted methyltransferase
MMDKPNLRFDERRTLHRILSTGDPWVLAGQVRLDFPRFIRALSRLERKGLVTTSPGKVRLTRRGRAAASALGLRSDRHVDRRFKWARDRFGEVVKQRPASTSLYDQGFMTLDSVFKRARLMADLGDVDARRIAVLGDDDLLSIALCLSCRPEHVTVFEVDRRVVDVIIDAVRRLRLPVTAECVDLRLPLPSRLKGRFHTFVTDPSETWAGLRMFIGRGLCLLRSGEGQAGYFGLTAIEASPGKWRRLEKWLLADYEIALTHAVPNHAFYHNWADLLSQSACFGAEVLSVGPKARWFNSSLLRVETLQGFRPKAPGRIRGSIFNDDEACGKVTEEKR